MHLFIFVHSIQISTYTEEVYQNIKEKTGQRPAFYGTNFEKHRNLELKTIYATFMYNNSHQPNSIWLGPLGIEFSHRIYRFSSILCGYIGIDSAYMRLTRFQNEWNIKLMNKYINPKNRDLLYRSKMSPEMIVDWNIALTEMLELSNLYSEFETNGYIHISPALVTLDVTERILSQAVKDELKYTTETIWSNDCLNYLLIKLQQERYDPENLIPRADMKKIRGWFDNKFSLKCIVRNIRIWGFDVDISLENNSDSTIYEMPTDSEESSSNNGFISVEVSESSSSLYL